MRKEESMSVCGYLKLDVEIIRLKFNHVSFSYSLRSLRI